MKARILVVDDDEALAEMIGIVLRNDGFEPVFCADGAQALDVFRSSKPDLVLLDLMLPGMDGIEVCRQVRAESDVPIVMLTAKADTSDVVRGLESGADDYVPKPFKPAELVAYARRAGLETIDLIGMAYNPLSRTYRLEADTSVNYIATFRRDV
jgi:two-component system response regulator MtrA